MKRALTLILTICILMLVVGLVSCKKECEHIYDNACDTICNGCEEAREITHNFKEATCTSPKACTVCGQTEGEAKGHTPAEDDGDCTTAILCSVCQVVTTEAKEHIPAEDDGSCLTAVPCSACQKVAIEARSEHVEQIDDYDCTTPLTCMYCNYVYVEAIEHNFRAVFNAMDVEHFHACDNSGCEVRKDVNGHTPADEIEDCTKGRLCTVCGWGLGENRDEHEPQEDDGNCETSVYCKHCSIIVIDAKSHNIDSTYTRDETHHWYACANDGCEIADKKDHEWTYENLENDKHKRLSCSICLYEANVEEAHTSNENGECPCGAIIVARVGNVGYSSFDNALSGWTDGTTLTLIRNVTYGEKSSDTISIDDKSVTLDLNGCTLDMSAVSTAISVSKELVVRDSKNGGAILAKNASIAISGYLKLEGGRLNKTLFVYSGATAEMTGGEICGETESELAIAVNVNGTFNLSGGKVAGRYGIWAGPNAIIGISGSPTIIGRDQSANNAGGAIYLSNLSATISGSPIIEGGSYGEIALSGSASPITLNTQPSENSKWRIYVSSESINKLLIPGEGINLDITRFECITPGYILQKQDDGSIDRVACTHNDVEITVNENSTHSLSCEICNLREENQSHSDIGIGKCICGYEIVTITGEDKSYEYVNGGVKLDVSSLFEASCANCEIIYTLIIPEGSDGEGTLDGTNATLELVGKYEIKAEIMSTKNNSYATKTIVVEVKSPSGSGSFDGEWIPL